MSSARRYFETADADRAELREAVAALARFIEHLPSTRAGPDRGLSEAWTSLVKVLALGPERRVRECPHCGEVAMSDATRCSHCWRRLTPLPQAVDDRQASGGGAES